MDVVFDFMSMILLHECFIKQACRSLFMTNLEILKTLGIIRFSDSHLVLFVV